MPEMAEAAFTELAGYRAIGATPAEVSRKIAELERDNHKQRDQLRERDDKLKALPPEGAVVLAGDDVAKWTAFQALNLSPDQAKGAVSERDALKAKDEQRTRDDARSAAAKAAGFDADVLAGLDGAKGLRFEVKKEKVKDSKSGALTEQEVAYVTPEGEDAKAVAFDDAFVESKWGKPFVSVLRASAGKPGETRQPTAPAQRFIAQTPEAGSRSGLPAQTEVVHDKRASGAYRL